MNPRLALAALPLLLSAAPAVADPLADQVRQTCRR